MSVEETLQYFDETVSALDKSHEKQISPSNYESESDLLSEFGYASGYTELSATSEYDDDDDKPKQSTGGYRRRKSRQNRSNRYQSDPILGDLESDSTNDGQLFGNGVTQRTRTRTNSGQRRQRERRRQRRQNANRNSWTDSGLSLSKTDSQRSSHSEKSPVKRARSKTSPPDMDQNIPTEVVTREPKIVNEANLTEEPIEQFDSGYSPSTSLESAVKKEAKPEKASSDDSLMSIESTNIAEENNNNESNKQEKLVEGLKEAETKQNDDVFELTPNTINEPPAGSSSLTGSLNSASTSLDQSFLDIKPTNLNGVVNGTYSPKEKEIMRQIFANARSSTSGATDNAPQSSRVTASSRFPLPPHLDYPFCMYRTEEKEKKSNGLIRGLKKLRQGITNKRNSSVIGGNTRQVNSLENQKLGSQEDSPLPPSKSVEKKKGFMKKFFKKGSDSAVKGKNTDNFRRDRFGSTRSFSGSVSQLFSKGNRARSQSVENLKNYFKRDRGSFMKRTNSSVSLSGKMTRSLSISSLIGRRNGFARTGSMVSIAASSSRLQNSGFRRADSVRSLYGGCDIATRMLQPGSRDTQAANDSGTENFPKYPGDYSVPFRGGWRPASRLSRKEPVAYDGQSYYEDNDILHYDGCYENNEPCQCCYDEPFYDDGYYNEYYEHSIDHYYDQPDYYGPQSSFDNRSVNYESRSINYDNRAMNYDSRSVNFDSRSTKQQFSRAPSMMSIQSSYSRCPSRQAPSYYSPAIVRRDDRMVFAPLSVQITEERRAERRKLSRSSQVFDTMV